MAFHCGDLVLYRDVRSLVLVEDRRELRVKDLCLSRAVHLGDPRAVFEWGISCVVRVEALDKSPELLWV
jgi:hypothetical protein